MKLFEASLPILATAWSDLYEIGDNGVDLVFRNDTNFFAKYRENIEKVGNCQNSVPVQDSSGNMVTVPPLLWPTQGASPNVVDYEKARIFNPLCFFLILFHDFARLSFRSASIFSAILI